MSKEEIMRVLELLGINIPVDIINMPIDEV